MNLLARKFSLGAEELIELGQIQTQGSLPMVTPPAPRTVVLSKGEAELLQQIISKIVTFSQDYPIEFHSYCPLDRWQDTVGQIGGLSSEIQAQLKPGVEKVSVSADGLFRALDLERCVSSAQDARLSSSKLAFGITAAGTLASALFGITWITVPTYIAGLGILFGRPLLAKLQAQPDSPYQKLIGCGSGFSLGGCPAPDETEEEKKMIKYMERVILSPQKGIKIHYWGKVTCNPSGGESSTCLKKGRWRVRVEGWEGDVVVPRDGWEFAEDCDEAALNTVGVWEGGDPRLTEFGELPQESRHEETYWVEYVGPNTNGKKRKAGPFGCPFDTRDHALEDSGMTERGVDGDYLLLDSEGNAVEIDEEENVSQAA